MWKDLVERTDQLRQNPLVKHLVDNPSETFQSSGDAPVPPHELDKRIAPCDVVTPLPADSSQMSAIVSASGGRDFVLIGPPGTGKSQTIANIISQCIASGKTVLFVAEKAAALNVVHRRLSSSGLGDAVLQLHSNKTDRKTVLTQLGRSWDRATGPGKGAWLQITNELRIARDKLNEYVEAIHAKGTQGFSIFEAIGWIADKPEGLQIAFPSKDAHDQESFARLCRLAEDLERTHAIVQDGPQLTLVASDDWSFSWEDRLVETASALARSAKAVLNAIAPASRCLGLLPDADATAERRALIRAFATRIAPEARDVSPILMLDANALHNHAEAFKSDVAALEIARKAISAHYTEEVILRIPLENLDADWREASTKFWPFSTMARRKQRKLLQTYAQSGIADPARDISVLFKVKAQHEAISQNPVAIVAGKNRDGERLDDHINQAVAFRQAITSAVSAMEDKAQFRQAMANLSHTAEGEVRTALSAFLEAEENLARNIAAFQSARGRIQPEDDLVTIMHSIETLIAERARISDWTRWMETKTLATAAGLGSLAETLETGHLQMDEEHAFRRAYVRWWLPLALDSNDVLRRFAHWDHQDLINTFRKLDEKAAELAPAEVMRRIQHGLPARDGVPRKSELGTLRHQLGLQRPSMPIRTLLASMPETFSKLAPCVLMSPLSIAQYLPTVQATFDIVIFDEASQITTWDAIGAIARGHQTIIVGDPKQLPPTNFFGRSDDGDEDLPEIERDMPSILDEVCAAGIPTIRLNWHYRSRDEALIAFSNYYYYGGGLITFPAPFAGSEALRLHKIEGTYARGGGRINQKEAKAIVAMIRRRLTAWLEWPEEKRQTLGVITFNIQQQSLILDLLDEMRRADPRLEWFFSEDREEPVIVKNLENIQGDERDVILFSITFGPDMAGKLTMNFGALNSTGGEKRLNVAITRSRQEFHIFSSITPDQIDLSRTRATGVRDLKAFLDYAERGAVALPARDEGSLGPAESPFEESVAEVFRAKGWEVRTQIGVSGYRIDLGIVNPDRAGAFLAGIECDGAQYHSSATARDRDKIRQAVLEGLGWNILRIWSTDWFRNPMTVTERLHEELEHLLERDRAERRALAEEQQDAESTGEGELLLLTLADDSDQTEQDHSLPQLMAPEKPDTQQRQLFADGMVPTHAAQHSLSFEEKLNPDKFFEDEYTPVLQELINEIVQAEGPLPVSRLARTVAHRHGWQRTGRRIAGRVNGCLDQITCLEEFGIPFAWSNDTYQDRTPYRGLGFRAIRDISRTEIAWAIDQAKNSVSCAEDTALELARHLDIARLSQDARAYLENCIAWRDETGAP